MARREFSVRDIIEIYMHWQAGEGVRRIARSLGLDRSTVKKYIRPALEAGFKPGEPRTEADWIGTRPASKDKFRTLGIATGAVGSSAARATWTAML
jgi:DNA-binding MarR family transcriptional regulator